MPRGPAHRQPARGAGLAWLLATLWLLAQGLGLVHGVAHGLGHGAGPAAAHTHAVAGLPACDADGHIHGPEHRHAHRHPQAAHEPSAEASTAFAMAHAHGGTHEAGDAQCRLIDQLAHADGLWTSTAAPGPAPAGASTPATSPRLALAEGGSAAYLARAPPRG